MALKHVMICHETSQRARAIELEELCTSNDIRSYFGSDEGDVNNGIAVGVENAALFVCLPSQGFQNSQYCMKAVCYADQCKIPFLCVDNENDSWKPSSWLGAVLAAVTHCTQSKFIETINNLCDTTTVIGVNKTNVISTKATVGGCSAECISPGGIVKGYYFDAYLNHNTDMTFDFLKLMNYTVVGQGTDEVGMFTIKGKYSKRGNGTSTVSNNHHHQQSFDCSFTKQYVGKHAVSYEGIIEQGLHGQQGEFTIDGMHNFGGKFHIAGGEMSVLADELKTDVTGAGATDDKTAESSTHWSIVLLAAETDVDICKLLRDSLAVQGLNKEKGEKSLAVVRPAHEINSMLRACARADVVVPIMSPALEADEMLRRVLVWCEKSSKSIVPAKLNINGYNQSGWLGVMMAGKLWFDVHVDVQSNSSNNSSDGSGTGTAAGTVHDANMALMAPKAALLLTEAKALTRSDTAADELVGSGCLAKGWYIEPQDKSKQAMEFEFFTMINGIVCGQGKDVVERFVLSGVYKYDHNKKTGSIQFDKSYTGTKSHVVKYTGKLKGLGGTTAGEDADEFDIQGEHNYGGAFALSLSLSNAVSHVMISYQWNSQPLVKNVVSMLKTRGVPVWFDIDGDMKGNINVAMATGVEKACCIVSFHSDAYSKSVNCRKELSYAASIEKPIIPVNVEASSFNYDSADSKSPHHWISEICDKYGAVPPINILTTGHGDDNDSDDRSDNKSKSSNNSNSSSYIDYIDTLCSAIDRVMSATAAAAAAAAAVKERQEPPKPPVSSDSGGGSTVAPPNPFESGGEVKGWYIEPSNGKQCPMEFAFFRMKSGRVVGQGDDVVSPFTINGTYMTTSEGIKVEFKKSYCGKYTHVVKYSGTLKQGDNKIVGEHNYGGGFMIGTK